MSLVNDEQLELRLYEIRLDRQETGEINEEDVDFLRENADLIEEYYRRRYMTYLDLCPSMVREHVNRGITIDDPESVSGKRNVCPTLRQSFNQLGLNLDEWASSYGIAVDDDTLDLR